MDVYGDVGRFSATGRVGRQKQFETVGYSLPNIPASRYLFERFTHLDLTSVGRESAEWREV